MSRVLFLGDSAGTGFGTVTRDLGAALLARGEEIRFLSLNEVPSGELDEPFVGRTAILGTPDGWLAASDPETHRRLETMCTGGLFEDGWAPEAMIVLGDMGSLEVSPVLQFVPEGFPVFHYVPIEGVDLPRTWRQVWGRIQPVAMCEFGADEIAKLGIDRPPVIYHGVDTAAFYPVSAERPIYMPSKTGLRKLRSREDCKRFLNLPTDAFVIYRADRLMPRKMFASMLRALAPVLRVNPKALLMLHCLPFDEGGLLEHLVSKYPDVARRIGITGSAGQADRRLLNVFYNTADLYVSTSAEGFGLTIAEAVACGVPAVGLDYSSVPEVIGPAGVTVPIGGLVDNIYGYSWARPDEPKLAEAVSLLMADEHHRRELGRRGPAHVAASFTWTRAAAQFSDLITARVTAEVAA